MMKRIYSSAFSAAIATSLLVVALSAHAVPLNNAFAGEPYLDTSIPGTTALARPELVGTVLVDTMQSFSFGALGISGAVQNRVVREAGTGTLDFYWRVEVDPTSTGGGIWDFRLIDFGYSYLTDADWRNDGTGTVAPSLARLFNPLAHPEGAINLQFAGPDVGAGDSSKFFFLHTGATDYAMTATYDLLGGPGLALSATGTFATYAPAVPEPASALLLALGLGGVGLRARRHRQRG